MSNFFVRIGGIILLLLLLLAGAFWLWKHYRLNDFAGKFMRRQVLKQTDGLYHLHYDSLSIKLWPLKLQLTGFSLAADTSHPDFARQNTAAVQGELLKVEGLNIRRLWYDKRLHLDSILLRKPRLHLYNYSSGTSTSDTTHKADSATKLSRLKALKAGTIAIDSASATLYDRNKARTTIHHAGLHLQNFSYNLQKQLPEWEAFSGAISGMETLLKNGLDSLLVDTMTFNSADSTIQLRNIRLQPVYKRIRYSEEYGYRKARNEIKVGEVKLQDFDFAKAIDGNGLYADSILIERLHLFAFKDKRKDFQPGIYKPSPSEMLGKSSLNFGINHVTVNDSYVKYQEIAEANISDGELFFTGLHARITNLTNDSVLLNGTERVQIVAWGYLQGKSRITLDWSIPGDGSDVQQVSGSLEELDLKEVNSILQSAASLGIEQGTLNSLDFSFRAGTEIARGELQMHYSDLKVVLLNEDYYKRFTKRRLLSFAANRAIRSNNPSWTGKDVKGTIYARRDTRKSVFAYWWQSIFSGIRTIILKKPVQRLLKNR